jgi:hypothetical protein
MDDRGRNSTEGIHVHGDIGGGGYYQKYQKGI